MFIVASEASDLLFKTINFHVIPYGPQVFTQGFSDGGGGAGAGAASCWRVISNSSKTGRYFLKLTMQDGRW